MVHNAELLVAVQKDHCIVTLDRKELPKASAVHFFIQWVKS